jgi:hypothetical protein
MVVVLSKRKGLLGTSEEKQDLPIFVMEETKKWGELGRTLSLKAVG